MMRYRVLTHDQVRGLLTRKLANIEAEHAALELELRLARVAAIENDAVIEARAQLAMLQAQHAALISWLDRAARRNGEACRAS